MIVVYFEVALILCCFGARRLLVVGGAAKAAQLLHTTSARSDQCSRPLLSPPHTSHTAVELLIKACSHGTRISLVRVEIRLPACRMCERVVEYFFKLKKQKKRHILTHLLSSSLDLVLLVPGYGMYSYHMTCSAAVRLCTSTRTWKTDKQNTYCWLCRSIYEVMCVRAILER